MSIFDFMKRASAILSTTFIISSGAIYANDGDNDADDTPQILIPSPSASCGAGVSDALFLQPYNLFYNVLVTHQSELLSLISMVNSTTNYNAFYSYITGTILPLLPVGAQVVVSTPNGIVMIDTNQGASNTYANFTTTALGVGQNNFLSTLTALSYPCGVGVESAFNTTASQYNLSLAYTLGGFQGLCQSLYGVIRITVTSSTPPCL